MLILMRKPLEKVAVGPNAEIIIKILSVRGNQVDIGIVAPKNIPVNRWEVHERIQKEKANVKGKPV